ncbi:MAG: hypothetical protein LIP09_08190 [Bacteroidales bacterium]|nr:hypothetical protein [Bacteroidales bacterium]
MRYLGNLLENNERELIENSEKSANFAVAKCGNSLGGRAEYCDNTLINPIY